MYLSWNWKIPKIALQSLATKRMKDSMTQDLVQATVHGEVILMNQATGLSQHARYSNSSLTVEYEQDPTLHEWVWDFQRAVVDLWDVRMWRLGYMLLEGERRFGEDYACVLDPDKFHEVTYRKARYICSRFPPDRMRRVLSFSHHEAVAKLDPPEQDAWLDRAESEGWTRNELRRRLKETLPAEPELPQPQWSGDGQETIADTELTMPLPDGREAALRNCTVFCNNGHFIGVFLPYEVYLTIKPHLPEPVAQALQTQIDDLSRIQEGS